MMRLGRALHSGYESEFFPRYRLGSLGQQKKSLSQPEKRTENDYFFEDK
jgi:hypothetical protein